MVDTLDQRLWAWMKRHSAILSFVGLLSIVVIALLVIPHDQICEISRDTAHENCSFPNALSVGLFELSQFFSDFGAAGTALGTLVIAGFTATLWYATRGMQQATAATLDHLRAEFLATFRPNLNVRSFQFEIEDDEAKIRFVVVNNGQTKAMVIESNVTVLIHNPSSPLPARPPYTEERNAIGTPTIEVSQYHNVTYAEPESLRLLMVPHMGGDVVHVMGYVIYEDARGVPRRFGFCRLYHHGTKRFSVVNDPEYEYYD